MELKKALQIIFDLAETLVDKYSEPTEEEEEALDMVQKYLEDSTEDITS